MRIVALFPNRPRTQTVAPSRARTRASPAPVPR
jgi:hypothetical protein